MNEHTIRGIVGDKEVSLSTGKLALQADGAIVAKLGGTEMLVTATATRSLREGVDFFPLTVDFEERMYAAGRIPGSFFRREGRPTEAAILAARLIDRPLRPSFPDWYRCETQVVVTTLSVDDDNPFDVLALNGASAALMLSPIPFEGPIGAVRLGLKGGEWIPFPTHEDLEQAVFELVVAGRRNQNGEIDIMMVEAGSTPEGLRLAKGGEPTSDEAAVIAGLELSKNFIAQSIDLQTQLVSETGTPEPVDWPQPPAPDPELVTKVGDLSRSHLAEVIQVADKKQRAESEQAAWEKVVEAVGLGDSEDKLSVNQAKTVFKTVAKDLMRQRVTSEKVRLDGRAPTEIRPLSVEVGVVERTHGSGLFSRGETQVLNLTTLGMLKMEQMLDNLGVEESKRYMHHYNFPPFSVGEAGFMRGPKRREIGHGALAEKALLPVIPTNDDFPYALRLVSEVLSSNGSTSMASVCASSLSLMDAGVPILEPVAGIAMGLIHVDGEYVTLTDILGAEDALGDMDFKVAGTASAITALQLDTKLAGLPSEVLAQAIEQARQARLTILETMNAVISEPRSDLSEWAPRIETITIPKDKIGEVIGPKGKVIRELEEETGATIEVDEEGGHGLVRIASSDGPTIEATRARINQIVFPPEPELGEEFDGEVVNITNYGAFINLVPGKDGLLHISRIDPERHVNAVEDYLELGDKIKVVVTEIDRGGKLSLDLVNPLEPNPDAPPRPERDFDGGRGRGGRDRDRRDGGNRRDRDRDRDFNRDRDRNRRGGNRDRGRRDDRWEGRDRDRDRGRGGGRGGHRDRNRGDGGRDGGRRRAAPAFDDSF